MDRKIKKEKWTLRRIIIWSALSIFGFFVIYNIFIFSNGINRLNVEVDKIDIAIVTEGDFLETIPIDGIVMPIKTIRLDAVVGGVVEKRYSEGGILIERGDTILKLSNNDLLQNFVREETQAFILVNNLQNTKLALQRNQFEMKRQITDLDYQIDKAKDAYKRAKPLFKGKIISEQEYLDLKREFERLSSNRDIQIESNRFDSLNAALQISQAEATLERTRQNLEMIKTNLDNLYIKAPIQGRLSTMNVEVGESIAPGQNIGQIDDLNGYKIRASIDEHYINRIYESLEGIFRFSDKGYKLIISKIYPEVKAGQFMVDMRFLENTQPSGIRRGQSLQIRLQLSQKVTAIQIPKGSFYQSTGGSWIFLVDETNSFATRREIRLGRQNIRNYEVLAGLHPGDRVVVSSYRGYVDKDKLIFK